MDFCVGHPRVDEYVIDFEDDILFFIFAGCSSRNTFVFRFVYTTLMFLVMNEREEAQEKWYAVLCRRDIEIVS